MFSGVITEIYKKVCESTQKKHYELKADIENASHEYNKSYRERHGQVKVFCVGMRKPIPLDDVYVEVQFLDQHKASRYKSPEEVEQAFRARRWRHFDSTLDERQDGTLAANDEQYLMLLGGPGVGKSTFLRKVGLEALKEKDRSFTHECIPVFLELKRFTEEQIDIEVLITQEFETCGYPYPDRLANAALKSGKLLILFDGLDEVPTANVDNVIRKMGDFVDQYSQNRFIASCRIAAYTGGFTRFTEVEMADFGDSQIQMYIKNWFASTPDQHRHQLDEEMKTDDQCWKTLNKPEHQATKELARNPLLLTLLCMVYDGSQNFPRNRASLYEDALNIFLKGWAAEKRVNRGALINQYLDIADEKRMLSEIAKKNLEINRLFYSESELIAQIQEFGEGNTNTLETFNASKILDTILIDQGIFVEQVRGSYSFSHLTFQEYLTANHIVGDKHSIQDLVKQHLHDERWREVFLLTAGLMREADDLLEAMESEASEFINTDCLKSLLQWAERITDPTDNRYSGLAKREFVIGKFFLLRSLNEAHKMVKHKVSPSQDFDRDLDFHVALGSYLYLDRDIREDLYPFQYDNLYEDLDLALDFYSHRGRDLDLDRYLAFYLHRDPYEDLGIDFFHEPLCHDFYAYMDTDTLSFLLPEFGDTFDTELSRRVKLAERMEAMKIFNGVDFKRLVDRLKTQREFIRAVSEGKAVKSPVESIHNTWLAVLDITNDLLAISYAEMVNYIQYLRAVDLIVACKAAAGRVSPDAWQQIEEKLLTSGT